MKKWYQSKTIWVNFIAALMAIVPFIDANILTAFGVSDTTRWLVIIGFLTTLFNIANRFLTNKGIDTTAKK